MNGNDDDEPARVITEDEITDKNGPGKHGSPYNTIIGYGLSSDGYATTFYCVVDWFHGVTNNWNDFMREDDSDDDDGEWVPRYGKRR